MVPGNADWYILSLNLELNFKSYPRKSVEKAPGIKKKSQVYWLHKAPTYGIRQYTVYGLISGYRFFYQGNTESLLLLYMLVTNLLSQNFPSSTHDTKNWISGTGKTEEELVNRYFERPFPQSYSVGRTRTLNRRNRTNINTRKRITVKPKKQPSYVPALN